MKLRWFYDLTPEEIKTCNPKTVVYGFDRLNNEYLTYGGIVRPSEGSLKENESTYM